MNKYEKLIEKFEREKTPDAFVIDVSKMKITPMDENFEYQSKNIFSKIFKGFMRAVIWLFGPITTFFAFKLKVVGRKNLKAIKNTGFLSICNHISNIDCLCVIQALRGKKLYLTQANYHYKKNLGSWILRTAYTMPFPNTLSSSKKFNEELKLMFKKKKGLQIYAEQGMWPYYKKTRPLKRGAFYYAQKFDVPVVPLFIYFRELNWWDRFLHRKAKFTIKIFEPQFINKELPKNEQIDELKTRVENMLNSSYIEFYGKNDLIDWEKVEQK